MSIEIALGRARRRTFHDGLLRPANEEEGERAPMATLRSQVPGG